MFNKPTPGNAFGSPHLASIPKYNAHSSHLDGYPLSDRSNSDKQHSTPLQLHSTLKASSFKQANHARLKHQTSPYSIPTAHHHQHLHTIINSPTSYRQPRQLQNDSFIHNTSHSIDTSSEDLSSANKTNPPTTPISSSMLHTSAESCSTSPSITTLLKRHELKSDSEIHSVSSVKTEPVLYVTPATSTSPSSSAKASSTAHTTYSRSSSYTSLGSFDLRSTHSEVPSEYSACNTGLCTPYSDLPDSPGDPDYPERYYANINRLNHNFTAMKQFANEEVSILTVDSNPSKSNDITIMERTIVTQSNGLNSTHSSGAKAKRANRTLTLNQSKMTSSNGSSAYNSEANSFLANPMSNEEDEEERVVSYDMEGSLCDAQSTRSNTSSLSFPSEPAADLAFMRSLLSRKAAAAASVVVPSSLFSVEASRPKWALGMDRQFTPPVKLSSAQPVLPKWPGFSSAQVNRSLFGGKESGLNNESDNESIRHYGDDGEDGDEVMSVLSVPSEIKAEPAQLSKASFGVLLSRASSVVNSANNTVVNVNQFDEQAWVILKLDCFFF